MRRNGAVVVDPKAACCSLAGVVHRRDADRQRSIICVERRAEFGDECHPVRASGCPGASAVGESKLFVVNIDPSKVVARRELDDRVDVRSAGDWVGQDCSHLASGQRIDDRRHDVCPRLVSDGHELLDIFIARVSVDLDRGDADRVEPERRDVSKRPDTLLKLRQRVVECPVGRPSVERNIRLRCGNRRWPGDREDRAPQHDDEHSNERGQRRRTTTGDGGCCSCRWRVVKRHSNNPNG